MSGEGLEFEQHRDWGWQIIGRLQGIVHTGTVSGGGAVCWYCTVLSVKQLCFVIISLFYLWRFSGNETYRDWGWQIGRGMRMWTVTVSFY
jgi:hypothetical protein